LITEFKTLKVNIFTRNSALIKNLFLFNKKNIILLNILSVIKAYPFINPVNNKKGNKDQHAANNKWIRSRGHHSEQAIHIKQVINHL
jgi:hypothetical protein